MDKRRTAVNRDTKGIEMNHICLRSPDVHLSAIYPQVFDWVDRLLVLLDRAQSGLEKKSQAEILRDEYRRILIASIPKTMDALVSAARLCDAGLTEDARTISRKLLEVAVTLVYFNTDIANRREKVLRFYHHGVIDSKRNLHFVEKYPHLFSSVIRKGLATRKQEILIKYDTAKQYYPCDAQGKVEFEFRRHWDGKSLNELITLSHMGGALVPYKVFCSSTHFSSTDVVVYIDLENSVMRTGYSPEEVPHLLRESVRLAGQVLQLVDMEFDLGLGDDQEELAYELSSSGGDS